MASGAVAGPLFLGIVCIQAPSRPGYDIVWDPLSALGNGSLRWIQMGNFLISGVPRVVQPGNLSARWFGFHSEEQPPR